MSEKKYIPGVCNIGPVEIKKRKQAGWMGFATTIVIWCALIWFNTAPVWHLFVFFPAMMSATGFLQAYMHFCAYFGFSSFFNFGEDDKKESIMQAEFRAKDRRKAWQIVIFSALIGIVVTSLAYFVLHWNS